MLQDWYFSKVFGAVKFPQALTTARILYTSRDSFVAFQLGCVTNEIALFVTPTSKQLLWDYSTKRAA